MESFNELPETKSEETSCRKRTSLDIEIAGLSPTNSPRLLLDYSRRQRTRLAAPSARTYKPTACATTSSRPFPSHHHYPSKRRRLLWEQTTAATGQEQAPDDSPTESLRGRPRPALSSLPPLESERLSTTEPPPEADQPLVANYWHSADSNINSE